MGGAPAPAAVAKPVAKPAPVKSAPAAAPKAAGVGRGGSLSGHQDWELYDSKVPHLLYPKKLLLLRADVNIFDRLRKSLLETALITSKRLYKVQQIFPM